MISFLKKLIFKFKPFQVYPALNIKKKKEGDTISNLETKLKKIEKRLIETEKACHLRSSEDRLKDLEEKFEERINHFPLLERKFIKLEIDKRILKECPETAKNTNYLCDFTEFKSVIIMIHIFYKSRNNLIILPTPFFEALP